MRAAGSVSSPVSPECNHCAETMKFVGKLPRVALRPELRVFRCHGCNRVMSEEVHAA
jgi:transposase-like protein